ncbi:MULTISPECIES: type 1 fimbrial protein [Serratia]|uniref:type 1 fimbrial protein n=1 Tax=Serratia TaxID=613 RepID=UPI000C1357B2|nr:type 1 fimbrial protein [Serratia marcescens]MDP8745037.1 type 1 fimbrial protein [Serratia marcescens]PHY72108.1 hypothetical protein CS366_22050 [Serratia marcescens]PIC07747.1 hypothetical protein CS367_06380 [Serratia marcescens]CAI2141671.1 Uncharacterised protein [Serratia marcescens]HAT2881041.1 type 1 fimbrial protein [Serratia marcescens]
MKRNTLPYLMIIAGLLLISSLPVHATMSGTIHFSGAIVEPACWVNHKVDRLNIDCSARSDRPVNSDAVVSHAELEYLDNEKTLAIAHVTYR